MKKLIIVVLIMCFCICTSTAVKAEVKFGAFSCWDEFFLPVKFWDSQIADKGYAFFREIRFEDQSICIMHLGFYDSSNSKMMNAFLFSPMPSKDKLEESSKIFYAFDYHLALAVFPQERSKVRVIAYKKAEDELQFFEQWELFKEEENVVPKDSKFRQAFTEWLEKQVGPEEVISENMVNFMLLKGFAITKVIVGNGVKTK